MQTFGYFGTPLYRHAQTTSVALGTAKVSVDYNMSVNPFSANAYYTGFGSTHAQSTTATGTSGTTRAYTIHNGNIINTSATTPITIPGITTKALMYSDFASGTSTILNPSATGISGNVVATGSLSLSGTTINFNPTGYSFTNGATSMTVSDASAAVLGALGGPAASAQPGGILTEKINKTTGVVSYLYTARPNTLSPATLTPAQSQTGYKTTPLLLSNPTDSTVSTPTQHLIQFSLTSPSQSNEYLSSKNLLPVPILSSSRKTTFNPTTNQVIVPLPTLMQTFGYFGTPLYRHAQTTSVTLGTAHVSVNYNMLVNLFSANAYYTGFGSTNFQSASAT